MKRCYGIPMFFKGFANILKDFEGFQEIVKDFPWNPNRFCFINFILKNQKHNSQWLQ